MYQQRFRPGADVQVPVAGMASLAGEGLAGPQSGFWGQLPGGQQRGLAGAVSEAEARFFSQGPQAFPASVMLASQPIQQPTLEASSLTPSSISMLSTEEDAHASQSARLGVRFPAKTHII